MSEFYEINPKHLALAEQATSFQLVVPDRAKKDRDGITDRWTEVVEIQSTDRGSNPAKNQQYYEVSVTVTPEGGAENMGATITRRFYTNIDVLKDDQRLKTKHKKGEDGQATMTQNSLAKIAELIRHAGLEGYEGDDLWGFGSPLVGRKVWAEIIQRPGKDSRSGKWDIEMTKFLPYDG